MRRFPSLVLGGMCLAACSSPKPGPADAPHEERERHPGGMIQRWQQRLSEDGTLPPNALIRAKQQRDALVLGEDGPGGGAGSFDWTWLGPGNIGGRIRAILIHPANPSEMWVGGASGGVWKTDNGGGTWAPQNDFLAMLSIGCMAMDPTAPNRIYAGTGEGFFDAVRGSSNTAAIQGAGIFLTTDGGQTWNQLASTSTPDWYFVNRIAIDPNSPNVLLAATGSGIWRSIDGGTSWTRRTTARTLDLDFHPTDSSLAVAGRADGVAEYTTDGGMTWQAASGLTNTTRIEIAYARSNPSTVYVAASDPGWDIRIWRSTNGGQSYALQTGGSGIQTWSLYNNTLWVDPTNPNNLVFGGVRLYRSTNAGASFADITNGSHVDFHALVEHPGFDGSSNRTVYNGNDGGIYVLNDYLSSANWQELNNNLGITQFYGAAVNVSSGVVVGGTQDNGTLRFSGNTEGWTRAFGGDGGFAAADPTNPNLFYAEWQRLNLIRSTNGGQSFSRIFNPGVDPGPNFIPYFMLDPNNPSRMLACGRALWRSNNVSASNPSWSSIKPSRGCTDSGPGIANAHFQDNATCNISTVAVALGDSNVVWVGHNDGHVYRTSNGLASSPVWTRVDLGTPGLPDRWISRIAIDPNDHTRVYVSIMGYEPDNLWRTTDNGASWQRITGAGAAALPSAPVSGVALHPRIPGVLYAATDIGLFWSEDDGATWNAVTDGPATVPIDELVWQDDRNLLVVTHGRGIYRGEVLAASASAFGVPCSGGFGPALTAAPPVLGSNQTYSIALAAPSAPVWFALSFGPPAPNPVGPCTLYVDPASAITLASGSTSAQGTWTMNVAIPGSPDLAGTPFVTQALILRPGGPVLGVGDLTQAMEQLLGY